MMAVMCESRSSGAVTYFLKGAPERITAACASPSGGAALSKSHAERIAQAEHDMATQGEHIIYIYT